MDRDGCLGAGFPGKIAFDFQMVVPSAVAARSDYYQDVIRPMGGYRAIMAVPFRDERSFGFLSLCRPARAAEFAPSDVALAGQVLPHLARALRARHEVQWAGQRAETMLDAIDRIDAAVAIVDAELRPVLLSRAAAAIVTLGDGLTTSRRRLVCGNSDQTRRLAELVRSAIAEDSRAPGVYAMRLMRPAHQPWSVTVRKLAPRGRAGGPLAMLLLDDATRTPRETAALATSMFGLTRREAALAARLVDGQDLAAAAAELGIAVGTTRNHLKSLFNKTDTHRQAELVGLLLRLARFSR